MTTSDQTALSEREKDALRLLLAGHDAKSIASRLNLSVHTVNDRLREARRKLGVSSSREAARRFAEVDGHDPKSVGAKEIGADEVSTRVEKPSRPTARPSSDRRLAWLAGGMFMMSLIIAAVAISTILGRGDGAASAPNVEVAAPRVAGTEASSRARRWVELLDSGQWNASWRAAGTAFKAQLTSEQWAATIRSVRQPLGQVSSRTLQSVTRTKSLPGAPVGDYQVLQFQTRFANKPDAIETVVVSLDRAEWRVNGYFVR